MADALNREQLEEEIRLTEQAMMHAGPIHYMDLKKHLIRMRKELKQYDRFQEQARRRDVG